MPDTTDDAKQRPPLDHLEEAVEGEAEPSHEHGETGAGVAEPAETAEAAAQEGESRLDRSLSGLLATGVVGGVDVSIGVIALVLIMDRTGNEILASLGFAIGFVALTLAGSELITENFLVPVVTVVSRRRPPMLLVRLWGWTLLANLVGGGIVMGVFALGWPDEIAAAVEIGERSVSAGLGMVSFARAMVAGLLITLMTWMQKGVSQSVGGRVIAAFAVGFLIIYTHSNHVVVGAFEVLIGLLTGDATYGWGDLLISIPWWLFGNLVGGLTLVTVVRLVQARTDYLSRPENGPS